MKVCVQALMFECERVDETSYTMSSTVIRLIKMKDIAHQS